MLPTSFVSYNNIMYHKNSDNDSTCDCNWQTLMCAGMNAVLRGKLRWWVKWEGLAKHTLLENIKGHNPTGCGNCYSILFNFFLFLFFLLYHDRFAQLLTEAGNTTWNDDIMLSLYCTTMIQKVKHRYKYVSYIHRSNQGHTSYNNG